ncbi:MAG TPA: hypothetical protein VKT17_04605 [Acidobacteriota bacterium]|nr:hypothetical protein [Acidobacteriota bacterium]
MIRRRLSGPAALTALVILASAAGAARAEVPPAVRAKAAGIFAALEKIELEAARARSRAVPPSPQPGPGSRSLVFSEDELNAYAACRLENEPYVKAAVLKLLAGDKVEGRITIDLGKPPASGLVPQKQDLLFAARIETRDGKIRINMDKLFLGAQAISPGFVDIVIGIVSRLQGLEPTTLSDWYDLPPGVLRLESRAGQVVVIY